MTLYDIAYGLGAGLTAPFWLLKPPARRKVFKAIRERMGEFGDLGAATPVALIHAVSLGEMNATRALVRSLGEERPDLRFIVTATTDTGYARGRELYGADRRVNVVRFPLDFSGPVNRLLDLGRPAVVVLMELEVWPNFMKSCQRRQIPVILVNGRLTAGSFSNYRRFGWITARMFHRLAFVCAQEQDYADRFISLGVAPEHVRVTGTMKFDTAEVADGATGAEAVAQSVGLRPGDGPIWVCGSTGPGEEQIILNQYRRLLQNFPNLRLVLVPRHDKRFDEVAGLIRDAGFPVIRRSKPPQAGLLMSQLTQQPPPVILGDTMGELRKFYSLADVVFVGRTLLDLGPRQHGSDMIEPAALAKPVIVGPFTGNFAEVMNLFRLDNAIREVRDGEQLGDMLGSLLSSPDAQLGRLAQAVVRREQGTTARNVEVILDQLGQAAPAPQKRGGH